VTGAALGCTGPALVEGALVADVVALCADDDGPAAAPWKSIIGSLRTCWLPELTTSALDVTVYVIPSFSAT